MDKSIVIGELNPENTWRVNPLHAYHTHVRTRTYKRAPTGTRLYYDCVSRNHCEIKSMTGTQVTKYMDYVAENFAIFRATAQS